VIKKQRRSKIKDYWKKRSFVAKAGVEIQGGMVFGSFMQKGLYDFFIDIKSKNRNSKRRLTIRTCT
jgi:hypothetical protein